MAEMLFTLLNVEGACFEEVTTTANTSGWTLLEMPSDVYERI